MSRIGIVLSQNYEVKKLYMLHVSLKMNEPKAHSRHLHWLIDLLTSCSSVLSVKLTDPELVKKFPAFYATRRFITGFTSSRYQSLSSATAIQSILSHPTSGRSISILSSHLRLSVPSGLFPSCFPTKALYAPILGSCVLHAQPISFFSILSLEKKYGEEYRSWSSSLCSLLHSPLTSSRLRPKYIPQHPILEHSQPMTLPQCKRRSFTPI